MNIPRKLLLVKREPPASGYIVMMENGDRTKSLQLSEQHEQAMMAAIQDTIIAFAVQHGLVTIDSITTLNPGRPPGSRTGGRRHQS